MNGKCIITLLAAFTAAALITAGCVSTSYEPRLLRLYQQQMTLAVGDMPVTGRVIAAREQLRSARTTGAFPRLEVVVDPDTQRQRVEMSLPEAVQRALASNPAIMVTSFDPAITREQMKAAEAEFDVVFRAGLEFSKSDAQSNYPSVIGRSKSASLTTSLSKRLTSGGEATLSYNLERSRTYNPSYFNDPNYASRTSFQLTQPLMRDFGREVNMARVNVARVNYDVSLEAFRSQVLVTVDEVQNLYWRLVQARKDVVIQRDQLDRSVDTWGRVEGRRDLDASEVQITDALSVVESSTLTLIRAERLVADVQGRLIKAIGDPSLQLLGEFDLIPTSVMTDAPVRYDPAEALATALKYNPDLEQVRRGIEIQDITVLVAKNQALPRLDIRVGMGFNGAVADKPKDSYDQMMGGDYIDYSLAAAFELPIGNRQRQAAVRQAQYERGKSLATLQDAADQLAVAVTETARLIEYTYHELIVSRRAMEAYKDNLAAMEARSKTVESLTPDFLNRLLRAQENVAAAERAETQAIVSYNSALATLQRLCGTSLGDMGVVVADNGNDVLDAIYRQLNLSGHDEKADEAPGAAPAVIPGEASSEAPAATEAPEAGPAPEQQPATPEGPDAVDAPEAPAVPQPQTDEPAPAAENPAEVEAIEPPAPETPAEPQSPEATIEDAEYGEAI